MSKRDEVLVTTEWVAEHLDDPAYRFVEVDEDTEAYAQGHIRGAIGWHWRNDLHKAPLREFIDAEGVSALLAKSGVGPDTTVILYGGNNNWFAAYAYWLLKYRGFDRVKLVDGGRKKWELENRELVTEVLSGAPMKRALGIRTLDLAQRLLDHGYHPPTVYFPLLVEEALLVEPTETETKETLDAFADAIEAILAEAAEDPGIARNAPYVTPVRRLDEAGAARSPVVRQAM